MSAPNKGGKPNTTMIRTHKKLVLRHETIRELDLALAKVAGGEPAQPTGGSQCWCPTADLTLCPECGTSQRPIC